jgi:hypothetical protein
MEHNWCPPISPPLRYAGTRLLAPGSVRAAEIIAIAEDGNWCAGMSARSNRRAHRSTRIEPGPKAAHVQFGGAKRRRKTDRGRFLAVGQENARLDVVGRGGIVRAT